MGLWSTAPTRMKKYDAATDINGVNKNLWDLQDIVAIIAKEVANILNGYIDANNIRANSIETKNLKAGAVTADKISVDELSAISANLGTITAGIIRGIQIFGSYIATAEGTYPRTEMDVAGDFLAAYFDADNSIRIVPNAQTGAPGIQFYRDGILQGSLYIGSGGVQYNSVGGGYFFVNSDFVVPNVNNISDGTNTIGSLLAGKANAFSGYSGPVTIDGTTLTFSNGILTSVS